MATRESFKMSIAERRVRHFSESFKIQIVRQLERGLIRGCDVKKEYSVSYTSILRWKNKYGMSKESKPVRLVVETQSDTKKLLELKKRVADLERIVGQKQIQLDFKDKMIELAEEHYSVDIKKKIVDKQSSTTGKNEKK